MRCASTGSAPSVTTADCHVAARCPLAAPAGTLSRGRMLSQSWSLLLRGAGHQERRSCRVCRVHPRHCSPAAKASTASTRSLIGFMSTGSQMRSMPGAEMRGRPAGRRRDDFPRDFDPRDGFVWRWYGIQTEHVCPGTGDTACRWASAAHRASCNQLLRAGRSSCKRRRRQRHLQLDCTHLAQLQGMEGKPGDP